MSLDLINRSLIAKLRTDLEADVYGIEATASAADVSADAAAAAAGAVGVYSNSYATTLPLGVTALSAVGVATGSGGTPGTYAGGVSGGPTGFSWEYVIGGDGKIASYAILNSGLSTSASAPTLTYPSGSITGATVPVATVSTLIIDQKTYWAVGSDSRTLLLFRNNAGAVAAVNNPDATQVYLTTFNIDTINPQDSDELIARGWAI